MAKKLENNMTESADFEFRHRLCNTVFLPGGKQEVADLLVKSVDGQTNEADVESLQDYSISVFNETKERLRKVGLEQKKIASVRSSRYFELRQNPPSPQGTVA